MTYEAVIFDLGGVVFPSPIDAMRAFERERGLPHRFLSEVVLTDVEHGAWSRLERGELTVPEFCTAFEAECAAAGHTIDGAAFMAAISSGSGARPEMLTAIRTIRDHGLKAAALTNNWPGSVSGSPSQAPAPAPVVGKAAAGAGSAEDGFGEMRAVMDPVFDVVVESAVEGLRKPDPRIYLLVCDRIGVEPKAAVFLDDLGANLKAARELGMTTIKVVDTHDALVELAGVLGFSLG